MRLCVSALAWDPGEEEDALRALREEGVSLLEHVPGRLAGTPRADRGWFERRGFRPAAFQALLFGTSDLLLFGPEEGRRRLLSHLEGVCGLARGLGVEALVFGSPRNRSFDESRWGRDEARRLALEFFREAGKAAFAAGARLCLETNPPSYGCNFLTRTSETAAFVREAGSPGIRLNLDLGAASLNGEDPGELAAGARDLLGHVHVSEPGLKPVGSLPGTRAAHERLARSLKEIGYGGIISIEMARPPGDGGFEGLRRAVRFVKGTYDVRA